MLHELGLRNLDAIEETVGRYDIDCGFVRGGSLAVATRPHEVEHLDPGDPGFLDRTEVRALVDSPTYLAGRHTPDECALVDPARLAWGPGRDVAEQQGAVLAEGTRLLALNKAGDGVEATTDGASVRARRVVLATNVFPGPLRRLTTATVPVYDYVLVDRAAHRRPARRRSAGTRPPGHLRHGANQFHYYRLHRRRPSDPVGRLRRRSTTSAARCETATTSGRDATLPRPRAQLLRHVPPARRAPVHRTAGPAPIDTSTRFCAFFGTSHRAAHGVRRRLHRSSAWAPPASAAEVMLDLLDGRADRADPDCGWCARRRCRSRPSRSPGSASSPPADGRSPARPPPAAATCGCAPSTGSGWASTPEAAVAPEDFYGQVSGHEGQARRRSTAGGVHAGHEIAPWATPPLNRATRCGQAPCCRRRRRCRTGRHASTTLAHSRW